MPHELGLGLQVYIGLVPLFAVADPRALLLKRLHDRREPDGRAE